MIHPLMTYHFEAMKLPLESTISRHNELTLRLLFLLNYNGEEQFIEACEEALNIQARHQKLLGDNETYLISITENQSAEKPLGAIATKVAVLRAYLSMVEVEFDRKYVADELNSIIDALSSQEEFAVQIPTYIKVGNKLLNPSQITAIDFDSQGSDSERCVEVFWCGESSSSCFYDKEAELIKKFFLSGSRAYDLDNLYG